MWYLIGGLVIALIVCLSHISSYKKEIQKNNSLIRQQTIEIEAYKKDIKNLEIHIKGLLKNIDVIVKKQADALPYMINMLTEYITLIFKKSEEFLKNRHNPPKTEPLRIKELREKANAYIAEAKMSILKLEYYKNKYPKTSQSLEVEFEQYKKNQKKELPIYLTSEIKQKIDKAIEKETEKVKKEYKQSLARIRAEPQRLSNNYKKLIDRKNKDLEILLDSRKKSTPHLAGMMSDFLTLEYKRAEEMLKLKSRPALAEAKRINELKKTTKPYIKENKILKYQIDYIKTLFPIIEDVLDAEYDDLDKEIDIVNYDPVRDYISKEEYTKLSVAEQDQLALDRYVAKRKKSNWQIGRDYELFVGFEYEKQGCLVNYFGSYMGLSDYGRDLIVNTDGNTLIIQCKYWSNRKVIHEKHINQLFGTMISYGIEHNIESKLIQGVFVTSTNLSEMAREFAERLNIRIVENKAMGEFPRIKCNIGKDEYGNETKIYHLPMDQQYDKAKICKSGECYASKVTEAIEKGFRRAWKWKGDNKNAHN